MIQLNSDLIELLAAFEKCGVRYLVIGGYAVGIHAEPRATKDIDLWVGTDRKNAEAVFRALASFGAPHLSGPAMFQEDDSFYSFGVPPNRVDLLMGPPGKVDFDDAWKRRKIAKVGKVMLNVVSREDLIELKTAAGRPVDKRDIKALRLSAPKKVTPIRKKAVKRKAASKAVNRKKRS